MPALTRKRVNHRPENWHVHYAGVRVGMFFERSGIANAAEPWEWHCGFCPGGRPGDDRYGTAADFASACASFQAAWREYLPRRTKSDFQAWRDQEAWTERKYSRMGGERLPSQTSTMMTCPCGEVFDSHRLEETVRCTSLTWRDAQAAARVGQCVI